MWLSSKLDPPFRPARPVSRPRLNALLDQWPSHRLLLVRAPAGYGKTSLVSIWAAGLPQAAGDLPPCAWLSLDHTDADPVRFVRYLAAALDRLVPGLLSPVERTMMTPQPDARQAMSVLLQALAPESELSQAQHDPTRPLLLVLDDYHRVNAAEVDALLVLAIERGPARLHFLILTRELPEVPLARLFVAGGLLELTTNDLRFDADEIDLFLQTIDIPPLSQAQLQQVIDRTQGWVAGLKLAGLSLSDRTDPQRFIDQLRGDARWQAEYLTGEVLAQQSAEMRRFLISTSILDRLNGRLCASVIDRPAAAQLLAEAHGGGLFIIALDGQRAWFRYHHLFQELLLRRLHETHNKGEVDELHRRAAAWFESNNMPRDAIDHYLAAGDMAHAYPLIDRVVYQAIRELDAHEAERWLACMRPEDLNRYPRLLLALCRLNTLREEQDLLANTARAERAIAMMAADDPARLKLEAELSVYQACAAFYQRDLVRLATSVERAEQMRSLLDDYSRAMISLLQLTQATFSSSWTAADKYGRKAIDSFMRAGFTQGVIAVQRELAAVLMHTGRGREAAAELERVWANYPMPQPNLVLSELFSVCIYAAEAHYWLNELDACRLQAERAAAISKQLDNVVFGRWAAQFIDQVDAAGMTHDQIAAADFRGQTPNRLLTDHFNVEWDIQYRVLTGRIDEALILARQLEIVPEADATAIAPPRVLSYVMAHVAAAEQLESLEALIRPKLAELQRAGSLLWLGRLQALETWRLLQLGHDEPAGKMLSATLATVARTGYTRPILNIPALAGLLATSRHSLAARLAKEIHSLAVQSDDTSLILTARERDVLELLAKDYPYKQIAAELSISFNTVRVHVTSIYRKLGVSRRQPAIESARRSGLLG